MIFNWKDLDGFGYVDNIKYNTKPDLGFEYDWFYVDDNNSLYSKDYINDLPKPINSEYLDKIKLEYDRIKNNKKPTKELELLFDNSSSINVESSEN